MLCVPRSAAAADVFSAIAEPPRRAILDVLAGGEKAVGEIVADLRSRSTCAC